jgi:hypothetical protein
MDISYSDVVDVSDNGNGADGGSLVDREPPPPPLPLLQPPPTPSRLQQKIDVVQQVVTVLEHTMSSGKRTLESMTHSHIEKINRLQEAIEALRTSLELKESSFNTFSSLIGVSLGLWGVVDMDGKNINVFISVSLLFDVLGRD